MFRKIVPAALAVLIAGFAFSPAGSPAWAASEEQQLVTKAKWTLERMTKDKDFSHLRQKLARAKGVMIFPQIIKGAFVLGGEAGNGVLLARRGKGNWSYPAFFTLGAVSFGLQIGGEDKQVVLVLMNERALEAIMTSKVKLGGDVSVSAGPVGAGAEASTTTATGADILAYAISKGAFAGISLEGAVIEDRESKNSAYYKPGATVRDIVIRRKYSNKGANPLRKALRPY